MNKWIGMGRLTKDPEVRYRQEKNMAIARYTMAVDRIGEGADFIQCVALGKNGEFAEKYLKKGMKIVVEGRIQTGSYKNDKGDTVYTTEVLVEHQEFCESKRMSEADKDARDAASVDASGFVTVPDEMEEEMPFK